MSYESEVQDLDRDRFAPIPNSVSLMLQSNLGQHLDELDYIVSVWAVDKVSTTVYVCILGSVSLPLINFQKLKNFFVDTSEHVKYSIIKTLKIKSNIFRFIPIFVIVNNNTMNVLTHQPFSFISDNCILFDKWYINYFYFLFIGSELLGKIAMKRT